jgi:hypothetical protein
MMSSGRTGMHEHGAAGMPDAARKLALAEILQSALHDYRGEMELLEKAAGMLMLGDYLGWRVLVLVHSKSTLRRYENILGIRVREFFPEEGPLADHSAGYARALELRRYWKVANGDIAVEDRRVLRAPEVKPSPPHP